MNPNTLAMWIKIDAESEADKIFLELADRCDSKTSDVQDEHLISMDILDDGYIIITNLADALDKYLDYDAHRKLLTNASRYTEYFVQIGRELEIHDYLIELLPPAVSPIHPDEPSAIKIHFLVLELILSKCSPKFVVRPDLLQALRNVTNPTVVCLKTSHTELTLEVLFHMINNMYKMMMVDITHIKFVKSIHDTPEERVKFDKYEILLTLLDSVFEQIKDWVEEKELSF